MSRSLDDFFDDSSDAFPPCDGVSNAGASVSEASVSTAEDDCNRI